MPFFKGKKGFQFAGGGNIDEYGDLPIATISSAGCVKPDGTTINVTAQGGISVPTGSDTAKGILQVDNDTIKATNGVLTTDALIKVATLPAASETTLGKIFMYTGETGGGLISGHIYKCTSAGDPAVYSWTELPVQDVSALAPKTDLSAVIATGTTNGTGSQIDAGTYFYLNGDYCVAKTDIAANATFTLNTNYEVVTVGGVLSELNSKIPVYNYYEINQMISSVGHNDWFYSGVSFTIPANKIYTIAVLCDYYDAAPLGVALCSSTSDMTGYNVVAKSTDGCIGVSYAGITSNITYTWYVWVKYASGSETAGHVTVKGVCW